MSGCPGTVRFTCTTIGLLTCLHRCKGAYWNINQVERAWPPKLSMRYVSRNRRLCPHGQLQNGMQERNAKYHPHTDCCRLSHLEVNGVAYVLSNPAPSVRAIGRGVVHPVKALCLPPGSHSSMCMCWHTCSHSPGTCASASKRRVHCAKERDTSNAHARCAGVLAGCRHISIECAAPG